MTTRPKSVSVRIDAETRELLAVLRKRLLDDSSKPVGAEVRSSGIPLGTVVKLGLEALDEKLNAVIEAQAAKKDQETSNQ